MEATPFSNVEQVLASLREQALALGQRLTTAGERLTDSGMPPEAGLADDVGAFQTAFANLSETLAEQAGVVLREAGLQQIEAYPESLDDAEDLLSRALQVERTRQAERQKAEDERHRAMMVLERVLTLAHQDRSDFQPLAICQSQARSLREAILQVSPPDLHSEVAPLNDGTHPLAELVMLVEHYADLDDETCGELHAAIAAEFGSSLATAALRGRLIIQKTIQKTGFREEADQIPVQTGLVASGAPAVPPQPDTSEADVEPSLPNASVELASPEAQTAVYAETEPIDLSNHVVDTEALPAGANDDASPIEDIRVATSDQVEFGEPIEVSPEPLLGNNVTATDADHTEIAHQETQPEASVTQVASDSVLLTDTIGAVSEKPTTIERPQVPEPELTVPLKGLQQQETSPEPAQPSDTEAQLTNLMAQSDALSHQLAAALLVTNQPKRPAVLRDLAWRLILEDRLALAYRLVQYVEDEVRDGELELPSALLRTLLLGRHVRHDIGDIAATLTGDFGHLSAYQLAPRDAQHADTIALLLFAATLRPTILAPNCGALAILLPLIDLKLPGGDRISSLREYARAVATFGSYSQPLDPNVLKAVKTQVAWQKDLVALRNEVQDWMTRAPQRKVLYEPATKVWQHWQRPAGLIHKFLAPIVDGDVSKLADVRNEAGRLSDRAVLRREVNETDRHVLGRPQVYPGINYDAMDQIHLLTGQAIEFARRWIELQDTKPSGEENFFRRSARQLQTEVHKRQHSVRQEFAELTSDLLPLSLRASIALCTRTLEGISTLFGEDTALPDKEADPRYLLSGQMLANAALDLDENWEPRIPGETLLNGLLTLIAHEKIDWNEAMQTQSLVRNHEATQRILDFLEACPEPEVDLEALRQQREKHLRECRATLKRTIDDTRKRVDGAVAYGLLREHERNMYIGKIQQVEMGVQSTLRFGEQHAVLEEVGREVDSLRARQIESTRQRLQAAGITSDHAAYQRIWAVLNAGDALTANEYIDMAVRSTPLPEEEKTTDVFAGFFPRGLNDIERFLEDGFDSSKAIEQIRRYAHGDMRRYYLGPVDMYHVSGTQATQVADMLKGWFDLKKNQSLDPKIAVQILDGLGFRTTQVSAVGSNPRRTWATLRTAAVSDKKNCPVWQYGSEAHGNYRLLCVWDRPNPEVLLDEVGDTSRGEPVIVFYFGRMTESRRRELAGLCRARHRMFIVLDDTLLIYLCGYPAPRLPIMFRCTLPFTFLEPYTTTAGVVPAEMFYGRQSEREAILHPMTPPGSCFIYGGRQLGKTALQRDVERHYHNRSEGQIVLWLDLKAEGIGFDRSIDDIWSLLARKLNKEGVIPGDVPIHSSADRILESIEKWLEVDHKRRVLLLLDEADRFLENDGKSHDNGDRNPGQSSAFQRSARIKGLMDRTNRRFKVVFAGLHNVLRTTRDSNHPLAHYGDPICIGPLLENGEWREARALVEQPLASIGYRFESPDLVTLILSQTNYYPSLIQLYCSQLIRHVTNPHRPFFDPKSSPPFVITAKQVNEVYQSGELRKSIHQRFNLTLQLDQRYEVIADVVAWGALIDGRGMVDGFHISWIRDHALLFWPKGFEGSPTEEAFLALADEMVGLGVLRVVSTKFYTLRSPNVLLLMGRQEDIEAELLRRREAPVEYEPSTFRSAFRHPDLDSEVDLWRRSPLTAQQESVLRSRSNGVSIIVGTEAAGMNDLEPFLKMAFGQEFFTLVSRVDDRRGFGRSLDELEARQKNGTTLVLVPSICPWNTTWVEEANQHLRRLRSKNALVRVVFVADPGTTWQLWRQESDQLEAMEREGLAVTNLRPWHDAALRQWLEDCGLGPIDSDGRAKITQVTGNWPFLLQQFYQSARSDPYQWERVLELMKTDLGTVDFARRLCKSFGVYRPEQIGLLKILSEWEEPTTGDLVELLGDLPAENVHQLLRWADLLGLAQPFGNSQWRVDPVVGQAVKSAGI